MVNKLTLCNQNIIILLSIYLNNVWAQTHVFVINFVVCIKLASVFNKLVSHSYAKFSIKNQLYYSFYLIRVSNKFKKKGLKITFIEMPGTSIRSMAPMKLFLSAA